MRLFLEISIGGAQRPVRPRCPRHVAGTHDGRVLRRHQVRHPGNSKSGRIRVWQEAAKAQNWIKKRERRVDTPQLIAFNSTFGYQLHPPAERIYERCRWNDSGA